MEKVASKTRRVALVGSPNTGKSTLFNVLCGLKQKTGNYPGITVDRKVGRFQADGTDIELIDLPGINSMFPSSADEELVVKYLLDPPDRAPDVVVVVSSAINLKRNLYLAEQVRDLELPAILVVNMVDEASKRGIRIDEVQLSKSLGMPVILVSARTTQGLDKLKSALTVDVGKTVISDHFIEAESFHLLKKFAHLNRTSKSYVNFLSLTQPLVPDPQFQSIRQKFIADNQVDVLSLRRNEAILRYKHINGYFVSCFEQDATKANDLTSILDKWLLHPVLGYFILLLVFGFIFQSVFWLAAFPMDWIDRGVAGLAMWLESIMPAGYFTDLVTQGLLPGIGGVVIFIPQIAILFFLFSLLEESGYMARVVFLSDRMMQYFGMSGKSAVPLISGMACAVPAIMSARTIENSRDRLITILVTPLLTCSARIPVYVILISLIVPDWHYGIFSLQGLALTGMYLLGIVTALIAGLIFRMILKSTYRSHLLMELPKYLRPAMKNTFISVWNNSRLFVMNAGKIILATSVILFLLATNGGEKFREAREITRRENTGMTHHEFELAVEAHKLEHSYLGLIGRIIEPAIEPLGYDWKIGIAVVSSIAAREVFVGTISTVYAIGSESNRTIRKRLESEINPKTGLAMFSLPVCVSLLLFYAFALQCLSTIAVTYKETRSLKWTTVQFVYMTALAYLAAFIAFQTLSN